MWINNCLFDCVQFLRDMGWMNRYLICSDEHACLANVMDNTQLAVIMSHQHAMNSFSTSSRSIYCFKADQHICSYPTAFAMKVNSPLIGRVNDAIQRLVEGGLIAKWLMDSQMRHDTTDGRGIRRHQLTIEHLFAALTLWSVFFMFAVGAFIAELIVHRCVRRPNCGRFWQCVHLLINDDRLFFHLRWTCGRDDSLWADVWRLYYL